MFEWFGEFDRKEFEVFWDYCHREKYSFIIANRRSDSYHVNFCPLEYTKKEGKLMDVETEKCEENDKDQSNVKV